MDIASARAKVIYLIQQQDNTLDSDTDTLNMAIWNAMDTYSQDCPIEHVEKREGDGTKEYALRTPYTTDFSVMCAVEYEIDENPRQFRDERYWDVYKKEDGASDVILFNNFTPQSGKYFRMYYTEYSTDIADVRAEHQFAVLNLAASFAVNSIANKLSQTSDGDTRTDFMDKRGPAGEAQERADRFKKLYYDRMVGAEEMQQPAVSLTNLDTLVHRRHPRVLHKREDT